MTATTDNRELRDRHIAVLGRILADHLGVLNDYVPDFEKRAMTEETEALTAAIALMRGQSEESDARDAARYRWLAENAIIQWPGVTHIGDDPASTRLPLDNAIDAAMRQEGGSDE